MAGGHDEVCTPRDRLPLTHVAAGVRGSLVRVGQASLSPTWPVGDCLHARMACRWRGRSARVQYHRQRV